MEYLRLIGVLIIIVGFVFKIDTIAVIIIAGLATALVSGISFTDFLSVLGEGFVSRRLVTIFILTLPVIGLSERYGLKETAVTYIQKVKGLTAGKFLTLYLFIREVSCAFSLRIGGHPQFVRPLIQPMTEASVIAKHGNLTKKSINTIKAQSAMNDNIGNFFAQNLFIAAPGTIMIAETLNSLGYSATALEIALASIPIAIFAFIYCTLSNILMDQRFKKTYSKQVNPNKKEEVL